MVATRVPTSTYSLNTSHGDPAAGYDEALAKFQTLRDLDGDEINSVCHTSLMTHGYKTDHAIVLIHGLTNCPAQFSQFAPLFFERGYNVFIPRMPRNGLADRDTRDLKRLTARELRTWCDQVCDIAAGLGDQVIVAGLSGGGTLAAWMGQHRSDVHLAVVIAPLLGIVPNVGPLGRRACEVVTGLLAFLPNIMTQNVSGKFKEGPPYGYYGFATRGLVAYMRLGGAVYGHARRYPQAAERILMVVNDADPAVNMRYNLDLLHAWESRADKPGKSAECYHFAVSEKLIHDIMDPHQVQQRIEFVYPVLVSLMTGQ